jgi:hypothetical protein
MSARVGRGMKIGMGSPPVGGSGMGRVVREPGVTINKGVTR